VQSEAYYLTLRGILKQKGLLERDDDDDAIILVWGKNRAEVLRKMQAEMARFARPGGRALIAINFFWYLLLYGGWAGNETSRDVRVKGGLINSGQRTR
jgi:hypothetical protein